MKLLRLIVHQKTFSEEDLLINPRDFQEAKEGDIVEIYHPFEEDNPRLLLQIKVFKEDLPSKDAISVEQSIATTFGLRTYKDVSIKVVDPNSVTLDSIELTFKDQYMGRSEMWRLKNSLVNTCVYVNKKLEFCGGTVRCQVYEMWVQGDRVACGVINDDTKIVFRSSTSMVYLFLQMSSEMWDFDIYGDLYFEKAVNGFLSDLFLKWKKNGSNHEVTIVLFSRTFYQANSLEEFPVQMRECLQKDYRGRYYEDFYRVAVQNEKYDDWSYILVQLRKLFSEYLKTVLEYHARPGLVMPTATNSTAAQGNFLEVLNMSLNVFEKHYLDRSFDRTGQLSVVVTPGVGIFEVDRELANITKQRIIDNGVGSDLVCVGEQPLHAVPLFKFHNKNTNQNAPNDYSMPHWINLSYYSSNKKILYSNFIPRIKLPQNVIEDATNDKFVHLPRVNFVTEDNCIHNSLFDFDAYDDQIFQMPPAHNVYENNLHRNAMKYKRTSSSLLDWHEFSLGSKRKISDPDIQHAHTIEPIQKSKPISIPIASTMSPMISPHEVLSDKELSPPYLRMVIGSEGSPPLESRALINPFDPSHVTIKLTSNRRRWTHIFPKGPTGVLIQQHHYQAVPAEPKQEGIMKEDSLLGYKREHNSSSQKGLNSILHEYVKKAKPVTHNLSINRRRVPLLPKNPSKSLTFIWGATGEQEWTPALTTGVDWKSLTIPACLPITTDYFPEERALQTDYVFSIYNLSPVESTDFVQQRSGTRKPLTALEVFNELISQRLAQGFQLVLRPNVVENSSSVVGKRTTDIEQMYFLSIGRVFHRVEIAEHTMTVTRHRPRHPYPAFNYQYRYRFKAPYHESYEESYASFTTEKLEYFNWNYLDHYICTRGDTDFTLVNALKYWRVYLLPLNYTIPKKISEESYRCDIYHAMTANDHQLMSDGFLKFIETIVNKLKKPNLIKKQRMSLSSINNNTPSMQPRRNSMSAVNQSSTSCNSPFRERLGSNRLPDRPRPRSGSKVMDRERSSPASEITQQNVEPQAEPSFEESASVEPLLCLNATNTEILEAMKHPVNGVGFLTTHPNLPQFTFTSYDAVCWIMTHIEGIATHKQSIEILSEMQKDRLICHASGNPSKSFEYGFFLYFITNNSNAASDEYVLGENVAENFENDWMEVEVQAALNWGLPSPANLSMENEHEVPHFLRDEINPSYLQRDTQYPLYKQMHLDIDVGNKSDRAEWGHLRYQTVFRPDQAYELVVEWLTASGSIVAELLLGWARKSQTCGLQMIPIPHDPLALPYSEKSDPLRGPIFVPLNMKCLDERDEIFNDFRGGIDTDRLFLFQEAIVARFGFIPCLVEGQVSPSVVQEHQYIHCTGTAFILIANSAPKSDNYFLSSSDGPSGKFSVHADVIPSPHEAYITRHVSGKNKDDYDNIRRMGFLWSWNHMISKRWRTNQAVDTNFQVKMLKDFREFCANAENRLSTFWDECWMIKDAACTNSKTNFYLNVIED